MIHAFSGDEWLAERAARRLMSEQRAAGLEFTELAEGMNAAQVDALARQSGLFGAVGLYLDLEAAFKGQAGVKPRNELLRLLPDLPDDTLVIVVDPAATSPRQKTYREAGKLTHLPTPRFGALNDWVRKELEAARIRFVRGVPEELTDLFGEDLPAIASEIGKLALLDEEYTRERVREVTGKAAVRDAFDLVDRIAAGDAAGAFELVRTLRFQGEAAARVLAALAWQFTLVARAVGLLAEDPHASEADAAQELGVRPFAARKALALARRLDEAMLLRLLEALAEAELAAKAGRDEDWALERLGIELSALFADA